MRHGFTLIEVMLAFAITAILSGMMYMCLDQTQRVVAMVENITNTQMRAIIVQRQLVRDISGAFIPLSILEPKKEKPKEEPTEQTKNEQQKKAPAPPKDSQKPETKKDPAEQTAELKKQLAQTFNGTVDDKRFKQLLLITNNPLEVYWSKSAGRPKPRMENVTYTLEPEKKTGGPSYTLKRITTYKKSGKDEAITQAHDLIAGIKNMTANYTTIFEEQKQEEGTPQEAQKESNKSSTKKNDSKESSNGKKEEKKIVVKKFNDWNVQAMDDKDVRLQKKLPDYVTLNIELWSPTKDKSEPFTFVIPIAWQEIKHTKKQQFKQSQGTQSAKKESAQKPNTQKTSTQTPSPTTGKK